MSVNPIPLDPIIHPWIQGCIANTALLEQAIERYGSPINIHQLSPFADNMHGFKAYFDGLGLNSQIFFARKANKCRFLVEEAASLGYGVDTASYQELKQALDAGVNPKLLVCTAAVKNRKLISLAIEAQVPLVLDNEDECDLIQEIAVALNRTAQVQVRLSGFRLDTELLASRFGFDIKKAYLLISQYLGSNKPFDRLNYMGMHFHLNGYSTAERAAALHQCIDLVEKLQGLGIHTPSIDFGGGILINYLQDKQQWQQFEQSLREAILHLRPEITYQNDGLGLLNIEGHVHGKMQVYPYYNEINKISFLKQIFERVNEQQESVADRLRKHQIEIRMEPGRSALDQVGITVAKVAFRRYNTAGDLLIGLEMNRTQLRSSSADFLLDPIHLFNKPDAEAKVRAGYLVGAYCLEQELILKRKLYFEQLPQVGDLFVFVNTAGYMMHFYESEAHLFELAKNLVFDPDSYSLQDRDH